VRSIPGGFESGPPISFESGLACPTTGTCYYANAGTAPDSVYTESGAGAPWIASKVLTGTGGSVSAVACASTATCVAVGSGSAVYSHNGGGAWTRSPNPPVLDATISAVACPTQALCIAVGTSARYGGAMADRSVDGGRVWQREAVYTTLPAMATLVCTSSTVCLATTTRGSDLLRTTNGGEHWLTAPLPSNARAVQDLSCFHTYCKVLAVDNSTNKTELFVSRDSGASWVTRATHGTIGNAIALSCASSSTCWSLMEGASESKAVVERSIDAGAHWRSITSMQLQEITGGSITCSASRCAALVVQNVLSELPDASMLEVGGASGSWMEPTIPSSVSLLNALAMRPAGSGWIAAGINQLDGPVIVVTT
jgi:photosystem II stability/assembly factor-like uncharacterized protein